MAKFCGQCGNPLIPEQKFCSRCGKASEITADPSPSIASTRRASSGTMARFAMIIALVLVAGALVMFTMRRQRPSPTASSQTPLDLLATPGSKFDVTFKPATVVIDPDTTRKTFQAISDDGAIFVFDSSAPLIRKLQPGSVMLLQGLAMRKVVAVENRGDSVVIATEQATLTDAIETGHIHWDAPISFAGATASSGTTDSNRSLASVAGMALTPAWIGLPAVAPIALIATPPDTSSGSEGDWKFSAKATRESGQLNLDVGAHGALDGLDVDVKAHGHVQSFGLMTNIEISHGVVEQFQYVARNLKGDVTIDFVATKKGDGMLKPLEMKMPGAFEMPMPIGGIPFVLSIGETIIIRPALSAKNEVAEGHFKINYGGGQGFSLSGSTMSPQGQPDGTNEITSSSSLGLAPFAYIVGFAMPRIELSLGFEKATAFLSLSNAVPSTIHDRAVALLAGSPIASAIANVVKKTLKSEAAGHVEMVMIASHLDSGPLVLLPCRKTTLDVHTNVGFDVNALGKTAEGSKEIDLGSKQIIQQVPPNVRCGS
jgi:hypothetical protein